MKKYILIYLFFITFTFNLFAEDSGEIQIKSLIEKIQSAKVEDRRELMNQLKLKLREINKDSRKKTVMELKKSLRRKNGQNCKGFNKNRGERMHRHRHLHLRSHR